MLQDAMLGKYAYRNLTKMDFFRDKTFKYCSHIKASLKREYTNSR
jgi:hypothetical protein